MGVRSSAEYNDNLHLVVYPLRFSFLALNPIDFPRGKAANTLRGAFGAYAPMFASRASDGPSGLRDLPRPFVFRAAHLDGRHVAAGDEFRFDMNLFDVSSGATVRVVQAFQQIKTLGARRGRVEFKAVESRIDGGELPVPLKLDLGTTTRATRLRVRFVTPTELKSGRRIVERPEFGILAARIRDRVSALRKLYGPGPLEIDFRGFGERAEKISMTRCEMRRVEAQRRSSRTGQTHSIGGFVGEAEYQGELTEFVPYLHAAEWTGVGRQTVWGKGEIRVQLLTA